MNTTQSACRSRQARQALINISHGKLSIQSDLLLTSSSQSLSFLYVFTSHFIPGKKNKIQASYLTAVPVCKPRQFSSQWGSWTRPPRGYHVGTKRPPHLSVPQRSLTASERRLSCVPGLGCIHWAPPGWRPTPSSSPRLLHITSTSSTSASQQLRVQSYPVIRSKTRKLFRKESQCFQCNLVRYHVTSQCRKSATQNANTHI